LCVHFGQFFCRPGDDRGSALDNHLYVLWIKRTVSNVVEAPTPLDIVAREGFVTVRTAAIIILTAKELSKMNT
jgi:hypothetical protein